MNARAAALLMSALLAACGGRETTYMVGTLERDRIDVVVESSEPIVAIAVEDGQSVGVGDLILEQDPEVRAVIENGLTRQGLYDLLNSDAVLDALRETDVLDEVRPLTEDLREALEEARARIQSR